MVVDDKEDLRQICLERLSVAGYRVALAANGREASKLLARERFDLVLTDLFMPDMDGIELVRELRKGHGGPPVVVMSGGAIMATHDFLKMARYLGAASVIEKPFSNEQLLQSIALALPELVR